MAGSGRGIRPRGGWRPGLRSRARPRSVRSLGRVASRRRLLASLQIGVENGRLVHVLRIRVLAKRARVKADILGQLGGLRLGVENERILGHERIERVSFDGI